MKRVSWTSQAYADLDAIYAYIARGNERYADVVSGKIVLAVLDLETFPLIGRVVPEYGLPDVRELIRAPYRIVYRILETEVHILMVHHASRPLPADAPG